MNRQLQKYYDGLEEGTRLLLKDVSALSSTTYHYKPSEGKWSISQILTHVLTAERLALASMKKKAPGIDELEDTGWGARFRYLLLKISQIVPLRYQAPKTLVERTPPPLSYGDLIRQWQAVREELREFLETLGDDNIRKKIFRHPRVGMLDVCQAVQFLADHLHHHRPQILAIINQQRRARLEQQ